jgi:hypothetical protein
MQNYILKLEQTLPATEFVVLTKAVFISEKVYFIGINHHGYNTHYTNPATFFVPGFHAFIVTSDITSAAYTIDDTNIILEYSLTDYIQNTLQSTSLFTQLSSLPFSPYSFGR